MKKKGFTAEQIIGKLREAQILLSQGGTVGEASRKLGVTEQTYYRWRREYGGIRPDQARSARTSSQCRSGCTTTSRYPRTTEYFDG